MTIHTFDSLRDELMEVVRMNDAALVIGAGATVTSGGPTSNQLVDEMRTRFPLAKIPSGADFLTAGSEVCNTPPYGRMQLLRLVKSRLGVLKPSAAYKQLPRGEWRALFTTNYDDLIEQSYTTPSRRQALQPVNLPFGGSLLPRRDNVLLFYLQGSIKEPDDSPGSPVVSRGDYLFTVQQRQAAMDSFRNVVASGGSVIYVGYSFADLFLEDLLDEAVRRIGNRNMPYGYAVIPDWPGDRAGAAERMARRAITPVEGTFEQFGELIDQALTERDRKGVKTSRAPAAGLTLNLRTGKGVLSEGDASVISEAFEVLSATQARPVELEQTEETRLAHLFLSGQNFGWMPFTNGWAFRRTGYQEVMDAVTKATERGASPDERVILVHGAAGLGKSVMARQVALSLYKEQGLPVLFATSAWRARPDLPVLERAIVDLDASLPEGVALPPIILIVDEAELFDHTVAPRIARHGYVTGRDVITVLFARTNEYFRVGGSLNRYLPERWGSPIEVPLPERINETEIRALVAHMKTLKLWDDKRITDERFWISYVKSELDTSFFVTLYSLVEDTREPLSDKIWSEFEHLSDVAKEAYLLIATPHQFGLPLKMEMLVRALGISFAEFEKEVIRSDAREVLFSEYETNELNIFYRGRSRLVSSLVFSRAIPSIESQLDIFLRVIGAASPSAMFGVEEVDLVRTLLVRVLGPGGFDGRFSTSQLIRLFDAATSTIEDDVLEHHYGLLQRAAGYLEPARNHLEKALKLASLSTTSRESLQNIENSLAQVIGDLALDELRNGREGAATELFKEASKWFVDARAGDFPNTAAYDAHARMLTKKARLLSPPGSTERTVGLADALDVVSAGIDNSNETQRAELRELRATILAEIGAEGIALDELTLAAANLPPRQKARYEVMISRFLLDRPNGASPEVLRRALPHAEAATDLDPDYFDAWRTRAEIFTKLHPTDFKQAAELLDRALNCSASQNNNWILYELGVVNFYLERYEPSRNAFRKLSRASRGNAAAFGLFEKAGERDGSEPFQFEGRIALRSGDRALTIDCTELRELGYIWFNSRRQTLYEPRLYDRVEFIIGFNFRGPQALELRKL